MSNYERILLVGGHRSGEQLTVPKDVDRIRLPPPITPRLLGLSSPVPSPYDLIKEDTYSLRLFRLKNGTTIRTMTLQDLTNQQAVEELNRVLS